MHVLPFLVISITCILTTKLTKTCKRKKSTCEKHSTEQYEVSKLYLDKIRPVLFEEKHFEFEYFLVTKYAIPIIGLNIAVITSGL